MNCISGCVFVYVFAQAFMAGCTVVEPADVITPALALEAQQSAAVPTHNISLFIDCSVWLYITDKQGGEIDSPPKGAAQCQWNMAL